MRTADPTGSDAVDADPDESTAQFVGLGLALGAGLGVSFGAVVGLLLAFLGDD